MGLFYEFFGRGKKKHCTICGCIMYPDSESDICEICVDELYKSDPGEEVVTALTTPSDPKYRKRVI